MAGLALACVLALIGRMGGSVDQWVRLLWQPAPREFGLHAADAANEAEDRTFAGAIFHSGINPAEWYGTYVGSDDFVGEVVSRSFRIDTKMVFVPILGYPHREGTKLAFEVFDPNGAIVATTVYEGENPTERPRMWQVTTEAWRGKQARLRLTDRATKAGGWLAVGAPQPSNGEVLWLMGVSRNYGQYAIAAATMAALLFVPGFSIRTWGGGRLAFAFVPLPGLLVLGAMGFLAWCFGPGHMRPWIMAWLVGNALAAVALAGRWCKTGAPVSRADARLLGAYACVVIGALAFGVLPAEVAQEFDAHSTAQARMIASPPDHNLPFRTAVYFYHRKDGRESRQAYFGDDWSVASRGPLAPFVITAALVVFNERPSDPPAGDLRAWPATKQGMYLARITGILTNALAVIGAGLLAGALAGRLTGVAIAAAAVMPVVAINVDFLWPKLFAAYFVLLAIMVLVQRGRAAVAAGLMALAYYSHPVGGLMAPSVAFFAAWQTLTEEGMGARNWGGAIRRMGAFCGTLVACLVPWLAYKMWLGFPDVFLRYPLGHGWAFAPAPSLSSWWQCRWANLWLTVTPGGFYFAPYMHTWVWGPLSEPLRWAISYAKTLPAGVGNLFYFVAIGAIVTRRKRVPRGFVSILLVGSLAVMLLFWGFSSDGLGRNCLEPLALVLVALTAGLTADETKWMRWVLLVTALETASVRIIGVMGAPTFASVPATAEVLTLAGVSLAALFWPLKYCWAQSEN